MKHSVFCFSLVALSAFFLIGCRAPRSSVTFSSGNSTRVHLSALSLFAKNGEIPPDGTAWFAFPHETEYDGAIEIVLHASPEAQAQVSVGLVYSSDLSALSALDASPASRPVAVVRNVSGELRLRMSGTRFAGFAVSASGAAVTVSSAMITLAETGWHRLPTSFWAGFSESGGVIDAGLPSQSSTLDANDVLEVWTIPVRSGGVTANSSNQFVSYSTDFKVAGAAFSIRESFVPGFTAIPARLLKDIFFAGDQRNTLTVRATPSSPAITGMRVLHARTVPALDPAQSRSPVIADPHQILEWPIDLWRHSDYEVFSWDRFPSVLIFDTLDYATQDRLFKRLAFFVEKKGYTGKLWSDAEIANLHAFNAHDYRSESLAAFFELARKEKFPLLPEEIELRGILLTHGILTLAGSSYRAGSGALISVSRESAGYLRYLFMAHEGFHGIYFIDPDFRAAVTEIHGAMDPRAIAFLREYFTVVDALSYDTTDAYLMENEFMAYILQQSKARVGEYFMLNIYERFLRYGGDPELAAYIKETGAEDFVQAAQKLDALVFSRWGLAGGRIGLFTAAPER